ncbi:MAG: transcriptional repressor LexA [Eubacteriaceae bacterium]|nr:transcriptional repressor LexA [Eubacteriaceae bacterium]
MSGKATLIQEKILDFIKEEVRKKGYAPSVREIGAAVGLSSSSSVHGHLKSLEKKGYVRRDPKKPRALVLAGQNVLLETINAPIIGTITAGNPITAFEDYQDLFPLPASFFNGGDSHEYFMLQVKGSSMINAGIMDKDYVIVQKQEYAKNSDIVVALIGDEATVKTYYKEMNRIRLQPENPMMNPIYSKDVVILGRVVGVFRKI